MIRRYLGAGRLLGVLTIVLMLACAFPAGAQQPTSVDPDAHAVSEQQLLQQLDKIQGRGTLPDAKTSTGPRSITVSGSNAN
jgi:formate dehydrogenase subunit gamma